MPATYDVKTSVEYAMMKSQLDSVVGDVEAKFYMRSTTQPTSTTLTSVIGPERAAADRLLEEYVAALQKLVDEREAAPAA